LTSLDPDFFNLNQYYSDSEKENTSEKGFSECFATSRLLSFPTTPNLFEICSSAWMFVPQWTQVTIDMYVDQNNEE
jgi:hypothetical protein